MKIDNVEGYAADVRRVLSEHGPSTVRELRARTGLSERLVRLALDRLVYVHESVSVGPGYVAGHRGAIPRRYSLRDAE